MWEPEPAIQAGEGGCTRFQRPPNLFKALSSVTAGDGAAQPSAYASSQPAELKWRVGNHLAFLNSP